MLLETLNSFSLGGGGWTPARSLGCIDFLLGVNFYNIPGNITKLPESGVLCDNITEFGVAEDHLSPPPKQSDIATQHTRQRLFCVYAMLFI